MFHHISAPKSALDWTHAWYISLVAEGVRPVSYRASLHSALRVLRAAVALLFTCCLKVSFLSKYMPIHRSTSFSPPCVPSVTTVPFGSLTLSSSVIVLVRAQSKWSSSDLESSKATAFVSAHLKAVAVTFSSARALSLRVLPCTTIATSSM